MPSHSSTDHLKVSGLLKKVGKKDRKHPKLQERFKIESVK